MQQKQDSDYKMFTGPNIVTDGLVLYLDAANQKSYPGSGTVWTDLSGNGNNGTLINGPTFDSGNNGNLVFDGIDDRGNILHNDLFNIDTGVTLSIWINRNTTVSNSRVLAKGGNNNSTKGITIASGAPHTINTLIGNGTIRRSLNISLRTNVWEYVTTIYKRSEIYNMYINGVFAASQTAFDEECNNTSRNIDIGSQGAGTFLSGKISNISWYNKVLTSEEILQNYNATKTRFGL
jgi:hypothetical protein